MAVGYFPHILNSVSGYSETHLSPWMHVLLKLSNTYNISCSLKYFLFPKTVILVTLYALITFGGIRAFSFRF